jgi:hypothetical protein
MAPAVSYNGSLASINTLINDTLNKAEFDESRLDVVVSVVGPCQHHQQLPEEDQPNSTYLMPDHTTSQHQEKTQHENELRLNKTILKEINKKR